MARTNDSREFVRQLKHGDEQAAGRLAELYGNRLRAAALLLCRNEADAQDLAAETLQRALLAIGAFREESCLFTWLYGILLNLHRTSARSRSRSRVVYLDRLPRVQAEAQAVGHSLDEEVVADLLNGAIRKLAPAHRDVVRLRYYRGCKIADIAAELELKPGTVKSRLFTAIRQLKNSLPQEMHLFG